MYILGDDPKIEKNSIKFGLWSCRQSHCETVLHHPFETGVHFYFSSVIHCKKQSPHRLCLRCYRRYLSLYITLQVLFSGSAVARLELIFEHARYRTKVPTKDKLCKRGAQLSKISTLII